MKPLLPYLITLLLSAIFITMDSPDFSLNKEIKAVEFTGDSGFIMKAQAEQLLHDIYPDSSGLTFSHDADTIGRYYKTSWGNYYGCVDIPDEPVHIVAEIDRQGKIIKHEIFGLGMHHCCWNNTYEGFQKHGNYYSIKTCGTGSGFCSSEIYVFDVLVGQDQQNYILKYFWSSMCDGKYSCNFYSDMEIRNDTVIMHYTSQKGILKKKFKVKKTEKFDIFYTGKKSKWIASDTTKLGDYQY